MTPRDLTQTANAQVEAAERAVQQRREQARALSPEYTLVANTTVLGTEVAIYLRGAEVDSEWTLLRVHHGNDAEILAAALREQGAPVTVKEGLFQYHPGGTWQPTVKRFAPCPESQLLAAEIGAMYRKADLLEAEWRNSDRWGESGARTLRQEATYKIARLKNLDPSYPVRTLRRQRHR